MAAGALERLLEVLGVRVDRPGDERRLGAEGDVSGLSGASIVPNGDDFVRLPSSDVGEYWPFVRP